MASRWIILLSMAAFALFAVDRLPAQTAQPSAARPWQIPSSDHVERLLEARLERNGVGVVVGIVTPAGRRVLAAGRGRADDPGPLETHAIFQIGSITKVFTGLLLADMAERGEVGLDDAISRYLPPGVAVHARGRAITLRDLATHMSGLPPMPDNFNLAGEPDPYEAYTEQQLWSFLSGFRPEHAPGEVYRYSNLGVSLLGRLLARRAGTDYETLLRRRVLEPLGLRDTAITLTSRQARRVVQGHDRYLRPVRTWEMRTMPASGSLRSTADDLLTLVEAYVGRRPTLLRAAMARQLRERIARGRGFQALGWGISTEGFVTHAGGKQGYRSAIAFDPRAGTGVVVLANARTYDEPMALALHLLAGRPLPPAPAAPPRRDIVAVERAMLDRYAGRYELPSGRVLEVRRRDRHLLLHIPGEGISEFFPTAPDSFFLDTGNDELRFALAPGEDGAPTLILYPDGSEGPGERAVRIEGPRGG